MLFNVCMTEICCSLYQIINMCKDMLVSRLDLHDAVQVFAQFSRVFTAT